MKRRKTLTDLASSTHTTLLTLLGLVSVLLGGIALFVLNNMALRGYAFQKEAEKRENLLNEISILETKIAGIESRFSLKKAQKIKSMVSINRSRYIFVEPEIKTASIKNNIQPL